MTLDSGHYYLDPLPPDPDSSPQTATVAPGTWTEVTIFYDTGIR